MKPAKQFFFAYLHSQCNQYQRLGTCWRISELASVSAPHKKARSSPVEVLQQSCGRIAVELQIKPAGNNANSTCCCYGSFIGTARAPATWGTYCGMNTSVVCPNIQLMPSTLPRPQHVHASRLCNYHGLAETSSYDDSYLNRGESARCLLQVSNWKVLLKNAYASFEMYPGVTICKAFKLVTFEPSAPHGGPCACPFPGHAETPFQAPSITRAASRSFESGLLQQRVCYYKAALNQWLVVLPCNCTHCVPQAHPVPPVRGLSKQRCLALLGVLLMSMLPTLLRHLQYC